MRTRAEIHRYLRWAVVQLLCQFGDVSSGVINQIDKLLSSFLDEWQSAS